MRRGGTETPAVKRPLALTALVLVLGAVGAAEAPASSAQCQAVRAVFYTSSDWMRLSQGLAADPSSCAQYYISIAPVAADKTEMRPNAASVVNALGPNFHALAEVNYTAWANWVATTGNSWYAAGQEARAAMDAAGFNTADGDTWAVNEFPSSVLTDANGARQDAEQLVEGLDAGDGSDAPAQGVVFMVGVGQNGVSLPQYKASLESWFQDTTFWSTMSADVSDFFFELYGDVRNYAVAGEDPTTRIGYLNDYLQAPLALVSAANAPSTAAAARTFLQSAYGPLANASWAWSSGYGWTQVTSSVMADFISAQTAAMRAYPGATRLGFAWNPSNTQSLSTSDFDTDVAGILDRLAGSIHETDGGDPTQACEATGCAAILDGADPATGWSALSSWTPTTATFVSAPQSLEPSTPSAPMTVELETGGVPTTLPVPTTVTLSSSSSTGMFATAASGPWSPTLTLTLPAGTNTAGFYTLDSSAGSPTLTANVSGALATQIETILAPPAPATPPPPPPALVTSLAFVSQDDHMHVGLRVVDGAGQALQARVDFALRLGSTTVATASETTGEDGAVGLTAFPILERGCYSVEVRAVVASGYAWNGVSPTQADCVSTLPAHVGSLEFSPEGNRMHLDVRVTDESGRPIAAHVGLALLVGSTTVAATTGATAVGGVVGLTAEPVLERGCYRVRITALASPGYVWDGVAPTASDCITTLPAHVASVAFARRRGHLHVALNVVDDAGRPIVARVAFTLLRGTARYAATVGETASNGTIGLTAEPKLAAGCYRVLVGSVTATGYVWDRTSPATSFCVRPAPAPTRRR